MERKIPVKFDSITNSVNLCGLHLALLRQFCGVTYLVVYASQLPNHQETAIGSSALVVENTLQVLGGLVGIAMVTTFSRYYMVTIATIVALFCNVLLGVGSILEWSLPSLLIICAFMFIEGSMLTSVAWFYPVEICSPRMVKYSSLMSMAGTTVVTVVPPFVVAAIPGHEAYPIFFFFAAYLLIAAVLNVNILPRENS